MASKKCLVQGEEPAKSQLVKDWMRFLKEYPDIDRDWDFLFTSTPEKEIMRLYSNMYIAVGREQFETVCFHKPFAVEIIPQ